MQRRIRYLLSNSIQPASKIRIGPSPLGGTEFYFPAARNPGVAIGLSVMFLLFSSATAALIYYEVFLVFLIVFGLFSLLMLIFVLDAWFGTTRVVIEGESFKVRTSTLGIGKFQEVSCRQIRDIRLNIGMQQQQTLTQSARAFYDIEVHPEVDRKFKAGTGIANKREARWVLERMLLCVLSSESADSPTD